MTMLLLLLGCDGDKTDSGDADSTLPWDHTLPTLNCAEIADGQLQGQDVSVSCTAADRESGVIIVEISYARETSTLYDTAQLRRVEGTVRYEGAVPGEDVQGAGMNYFFEAIDASEYHAYFPENGIDDPMHFRIDLE